MFEVIENIIQVVVLFICLGLTVYKAVMNKSRIHVMLMFLYASYLLGELYWITCLMYFGETPDITLISDLSWYATYILLFLLLRMAYENKKNRESEPESRINMMIALLGPIFAAGMAVFYMQWGSIVNNIVYGVLMGTILYSVIRGFISTKGPGNRAYRHLCLVTLVFCLAEYGAWTSSCFVSGSTIKNPYLWFDLLLTISFPGYLVVINREVAE